MSTEMQTKVQASPVQNFTPVQTGLLQRQSALCNTPRLMEDSGRDKEKLTLQRSSVDQAVTTTVLPIVHEVLRSPGQPLDSETHAYMEPRFGHDFSRVRIHSDVKAAESARAIDALAYAVGQDVAFAEGKYRPDTNAGKSLIAHELAHVVQQDRGSFDSHPEDRADLSARQVLEGQAVSSSLVGGAPYGLYRQRTETSKEEKKKPGEKAGKEQKVIVPAINPSEKKTETPEMPSRLPIPWLSGGSFSFGLHLGFPKLAEETELQKKLLGGRPDFLKESLQHAQVINQMLTGKVPTGWEEADKGELARYVWEIFSRNIAPDLAAKITSGLSTSTGPAGLSYELDLLLITDFSKEIGGGASFTVRW